MTSEKYSIITFPSTNYALKAERVLTKKGFKAKAIPVPRNISSDCGIALKVLRSDMNEIDKLFDAEDLQTQGVYDL